MRKRKPTADLGADLLCNRNDGPESQAIAAELVEQLRLALVQLDPRQAEVFCLARIEEMSYSEIAERLEISTSHVGVLLHRARTTLQEQLSPYYQSQASELVNERKQ